MSTQNGSNMSDQQLVDQYDVEIDVKKLFGIIWADKFRVIAVTIIFVIISIGYALTVPNQYQATVLLAPAQQGSGGLAGAGGQLGGLAALAGVSLGGGEADETQIATAIMKSWSFIEAFIEDNDIAVEVFAAKGWDKGKGELKFEPDWYDTSKGQWLIKSDKGAELGPPTSWKLYEEFLKKLSISEDKKTGLISVSIEFYSPEIALSWVELYVSAINKHMQERKIAKVSKNIEYLNAQIKKTSITEMKAVFYTIIEEQIKSQMLAQASPDYAFASVSPGMLPERKSQPHRVLIVAMGAIIGVILALVLAFGAHFRKTI